MSIKPVLIKIKEEAGDEGMRRRKEKEKAKPFRNPLWLQLCLVVSLAMFCI